MSLEDMKTVANSCKTGGKNCGNTNEFREPRSAGGKETHEKRAL
jgi:hypothetical protein